MRIQCLFQFSSCLEVNLHRVSFHIYISLAFRTAYSMIRDAEEKGLISPGKVSN